MQNRYSGLAPLRDLLSWTQWWRIPCGSREIVEQARDARLQHLLSNAVEHVPHYSRMFRQLGISPSRIGSAEDLRLLPVSEKRVLRQLPQADLLSDQFSVRRLKRYVTTGSTGVPFEVFKAASEIRVALALRRRVAHYFGLRIREKALRLTSGTPRPWPWRALERIGLYPGMTASLIEAPRNLAKIIQDERPAVILGNPVVLTSIAEEISARGGLGNHPRFIISGAEVLTPGMRCRIEEVFGCPVYDSYNCIETMHPVAWECMQTGLYHVSDDALILEVLRDGKPVAEGEQGEVVITSLVSRAMPIIRYSQGDMVVRGPSPCPCGCPLSTLVSISGRMTDYFFLPDGRRVFAPALAYILHRNADWILQYELVQESHSSLVLRASVLRRPGEEEIRMLLRECSGLLGDGVDMKVELVSGFDRTPGTKFRVLRTSLGSPYDSR